MYTHPKLQQSRRSVDTLCMYLFFQPDSVALRVTCRHVHNTSLSIRCLWSDRGVCGSVTNCDTITRVLPYHCSRSCEHSWTRFCYFRSSVRPPNCLDPVVFLVQAHKRRGCCLVRYGNRVWVDPVSMYCSGPSMSSRSTIVPEEVTRQLLQDERAKRSGGRRG
jgi:hypothetical protein